MQGIREASIDERHLTLSKALAGVCKQYHAYGLQWHSIPKRFRDMCDVFHDDVYKCDHLLLVTRPPGASVEDAKVPEFITELETLYSLRASARELIWKDEIDLAHFTVDAAEAILANLLDLISSMQAMVYGQVEFYQTVRRVLHETGEDRRLAVEAKDAWISVLPEIREALELGLIDNAEQGEEGFANLDDGPGESTALPYYLTDSAFEYEDESENGAQDDEEDGEEEEGGGGGGELLDEMR